MRIRVLSDLHIEFGGVDIHDDIGCDVVVLAGDIDVLKRASVPAWARGTFPEREIIWVLGNHEHYGWDQPGGMQGSIRFARAEAAKHRVHLLENERVDLSGVRFLGCTLWTDLLLMGDAEKAAKAAREIMADFQVIHVVTDDGVRLRPFTPEDSKAIHARSVSWLDRELAKPFEGRTVVITHHTPHRRCNHPLHATSPLSPAFCSDLSWLIEKRSPDVWISGHTHANFRFRVGSTLVISNQRGYSNTPEVADAPFDPTLVVMV